MKTKIKQIWNRQEPIIAVSLRLVFRSIKWIGHVIIEAAAADPEKAPHKPEKSEYTRYSKLVNGVWVTGYRDEYGNEIKDD